MKDGIFYFLHRFSLLILSGQPSQLPLSIPDLSASSFLPGVTVWRAEVKHRAAMQVFVDTILSDCGRRFLVPENAACTCEL